MPRSPEVVKLSFEDAMSVHVLRAQGVIFTKLTCVFEANPARFHEILCGDLYPESWEEAVLRLSKGEIWHSEIARFVERYGLQTVLAALRGANPSKKRFQRELKRQRRWVALIEPSPRLRSLPWRR
ncbi:MAG: hypothetical protein JWM91_1368 [Rhodospirillales bacterium]|nr:hypothetical protein [Rhodospirillales bacterium]